MILKKKIQTILPIEIPTLMHNKQIRITKLKYKHNLKLEFKRKHKLKIIQLKYKKIPTALLFNNKLSKQFKQILKFKLLSLRQLPLHCQWLLYLQ
jgi:hypothetical protein